MGMFDTVFFTCPNCGRSTSAQSKAGACMLRNYRLDDCPPEIVRDIERDGREARLWCEHCHAPLRLRVKYRIDAKVEVRPDNPEDDFDDWRDRDYDD